MNGELKLVAFERQPAGEDAAATADEGAGDGGAPGPHAAGTQPVFSHSLRHTWRAPEVGGDEAPSCRAVCFLHGCDSVLSGYADRTLRLYDVASGKQKQACPGVVFRQVLRQVLRSGAQSCLCRLQTQHSPSRHAAVNSDGLQRQNSNLFITIFYTCICLRFNMSEPRRSDRKRTATDFLRASAPKPLGGRTKDQGTAPPLPPQQRALRPCSRSTSASRQPATTSTAGSFNSTSTSTATAACSSLPALVPAAAERCTATCTTGGPCRWARSRRPSGWLRRCGSWRVSAVQLQCSYQVHGWDVQGGQHREFADTARPNDRCAGCRGCNA